ncbi:MAG: tryptophan--tRNA ligase [Betaproteobacteria bacterium]|nr:tryptophan--tRNA ligase [Betaproteobacteria bacterium]
MSQRVLTGVTTTGTPHLGNYVGAIRPAVAASREAGVESFLFLADYHALIKCDDPARVARSRLEIAATWLACGLDPERVTFYRQSDIPEIPELNWLLTCVTSKGLMNRAHAYKAAADANQAQGEEEDAGVTLGLFCYPVLMAADILMFNAHRVPVGRDQVQHIEMARDIATRFNHLYGQGRELFVLPQAQIDEAVATLPGLDGRKMSKSYDNTLPLFHGGAKVLRETVSRIVTDSRLPGEPKDPEGSALVMIHDAVATADERAAFHADLRAGLGWGEAKARTTAVLEGHLAPMRERYEALLARPDELEDILLHGARKARAVATPFLHTLREAVGLGRLSGPNGSSRTTAPNQAASADKLASFKQYRQADGRFYFKLAAPDGAVLLQSQGFEGGRDAGQWVARIRSEGLVAAQAAPVALGPGVDWGRVQAALQALQAQDAQG